MEHELSYIHVIGIHKGGNNKLKSFSLNECHCNFAPYTLKRFTRLFATYEQATDTLFILIHAMTDNHTK